jgi:hypothetical protein
MSGAHPTVGPELRHLARTILASLEPAIQAATDYTARTASTPGKCQQTWCPLCALAALASGEQHPLSTLVAEHGASMLALILAMVTESAPPQHDPETTKDATFGGASQPQPATQNGYQPIAVPVVD